MKIYPHICLRKWDKIKQPWGCENIRYVIGMVEWRLITTDNVHIFSPPRGFYLKESEYFKPIY